MYTVLQWFKLYSVWTNFIVSCAIFQIFFLQDPYIACPGYVKIPPPHELIFSSGEIPGPEVQCRKCDLRLTPDNKAVIVECFQCFDIPSTKRPAVSHINQVYISIN